MKKTKEMVKLMGSFLALLVLIFMVGEAYAQGAGQDSVTVTWYVSYDGSYDYVYQQPVLSDLGKIALILAIISTFIGYKLWRRSRQRVTQ